MHQNHHLMRHIITLVVLSFAFTITNAQENLTAALHTEKKIRSSDLPDEKTAKSEKQFVFKVYSCNSTPEGEVETHYMGDAIAVKWTMVNELYIRKTEVSVGFGSSYTETFKPSILNAVYRMNAYYKKALSHKTIAEDDAKKQFSWILDCAITICYCPDSADFEQALAKTKEPDQIVSLFNLVKIEKD